MMSPDSQQDFFALFNLPCRFALDGSALEQGYRALQAEVHPDRHAHLPEAERLRVVQQATCVNEAYQTLRKPLERARYLLSLHGIAADEERALPVDFLQRQMEWREAIEAARMARDVAELDGLEQRLHEEERALEAALARTLDEQQDYAAAAALVRTARFYERLAEEIAAAYDELDD